MSIPERDFPRNDPIITCVPQTIAHGAGPICGKSSPEKRPRRSSMTSMVRRTKRSDEPGRCAKHIRMTVLPYKSLARPAAPARRPAPALRIPVTLRAG